MIEDPNYAASNFELVSKIVQLLEPLPDDSRAHVLRTAFNWFRIPVYRSSGTGESISESTSESFAYGGDGGRLRPVDDEKFLGRAELTPKQFLMEKDPQTDLERIACLAYYLTHYRNIPHFKNIDLSKLNTEAAQRKFANPAVTVQNAMRDGFLVPASKGGSKQLSTLGERFVQALPDRQAALLLRRRKTPRAARKSRGLPPIKDYFKVLSKRRKLSRPKYTPSETAPVPAGN